MYFILDNSRRLCCLKTRLYLIAFSVFSMLTMIIKFLFLNILHACQPFLLKLLRKIRLNVCSVCYYVFIFSNFHFLNLFLIVSFQIYDFDGDSFISVTDLTAVIAASLRECQIVILRTEIDRIVQQTMKIANPKHPNMISFDE